MKRITILVALAIVALVGISAGSYTAYVVERDRPRQGLPSDPPSSPVSSPTTPPGRDPSLFYYADDTIHDGDRTVPVTLSREYSVASLERVGDGWLMVQLLSEGGEQEDYYGTYVYPDGRTWDLGPFGLNWDVDADGRILFSPQQWSWSRADPQTHQIRQLDIVDGSGDDPAYMATGEPALWIQAAGDDVVTGWSSPKGGRMVRTETDGYTHAEVGKLGTSRPNISPDGELMVDNPLIDADAQCLTGGPLTGDDWWESCDHLRVDYGSPFAPDGEHLLTVDHTTQPRDGLGQLVVLNARTGEQDWRIDTPTATYDAAWVDEDTIHLLTRPDGEGGDSVLYVVGPDGKPGKVQELPSTAVLGRA